MHDVNKCANQLETCTTYVCYEFTASSTKIILASPRDMFRGKQMRKEGLLGFWERKYFGINNLAYNRNNKLYISLAAQIYMQICIINM